MQYLVPTTRSKNARRGIFSSLFFISFSIWKSVSSSTIPRIPPLEFVSEFQEQDELSKGESSEERTTTNFGQCQARVRYLKKTFYLTAWSHLMDLTIQNAIGRGSRLYWTQDSAKKGETKPGTRDENTYPSKESTRTPTRFGLNRTMKGRFHVLSLACRGHCCNS